VRKLIDHYAKSLERNSWQKHQKQQTAKIKKFNLHGLFTIKSKG